MTDIDRAGPPPESGPRPLARPLFAAVWAIAALALFLAVRPTMRLSLHWDEVDYVVAARMGIRANATDATALSAPDFLEFVRAKSKGSPSNVSPGYDESRDVFLLRHTHPPLLQYALALLGQERLAPGHEFAQRFVQFAGGVALIGTMLWGYGAMSPRTSLTGAVVVAASGVLCAYYLCRDLNCHLWIAIWLVPVSLAVGRAIREPSSRTGLIAGAMLGIAFLGLQTGLFAAFWAVVALGIALVRPRSHEPLSPRQRFRLWFGCSASMVAGFFAVVLLTYPGAIFRLSLIRIFAAYAYAIMLGNEYTNVASVKLDILLKLLPLIVLALAGFAGFAARRDHASRAAVFAALCIGTGYGLIMQKFLLNVTYIVPSFALLAVPGAAALDSIRPKLPRFLAAGFMMAYAAVAITANPASNLHRPTVEQIERLADLVGSRRAWVEGGHILRYYRPELAPRIDDVTTAKGGTELTARDRRKLIYVPIPDEQLAGRVLMLGMLNGFPPYAWENSLPAGTRAIDSPIGTGRIYELPDVMPARAGEASRPPAADEPQPQAKNRP